MVGSSLSRCCLFRPGLVLSGVVRSGLVGNTYFNHNRPDSARPYHNRPNKTRKDPAMPIHTVEDQKWRESARPASIRPSREFAPPNIAKTCHIAPYIAKPCQVNLGLSRHSGRTFPNHAKYRQIITKRAKYFQLLPNVFGRSKISLLLPNPAQSCQCCQIWSELSKSGQIPSKHRSILLI